MENAGIDVIGYDRKFNEYTIRVTPKDFHTHEKLLTDIIKRAYDYASKE